MPRPDAVESLEQNRGCLTIFVGTLVVLAIVAILATIYTVSVAQNRAAETLRRGLMDRIMTSDLGAEQKARLRDSVMRLTSAYHDGALSLAAVRRCTQRIDPLIKIGVAASRLRLLTLTAGYTPEEEDLRVESVRQWVYLGLSDRLDPHMIDPIYDALVETKPAGITMRSLEPKELERWLSVVDREITRSTVTFPAAYQNDLAARVDEVIHDRLATTP